MNYYTPARVKDAIVVFNGCEYVPALLAHALEVELTVTRQERDAARDKTELRLTEDVSHEIGRLYLRIAELERKP